MTETYRVAGSFCPDCGKEMDAADPVGDGRAPRSGDLAICFYCHHLSTYGEDMVLRNLNDREVFEAAGDPEIVRAMTMLGKFKQWERDTNAAQTPTDNRRARRARQPG